MNLRNIPFGKPSAFNAIIEIPQGTSEKYEYNEKLQKFCLDFVFHGLKFPFNYGFISQTMTPDQDPLDVCVLQGTPLSTGSVVLVRPIGVIKMKDRGVEDHKILAVPIKNRAMKNYKDIDDISESLRQAYSEFYVEVAKQKNKQIILEGFFNKDSAEKILRNSLAK